MSRGAAEALDVSSEAPDRSMNSWYALTMLRLAQPPGGGNRNGLGKDRVPGVSGPWRNRTSNLGIKRPPSGTTPVYASPQVLANRAFLVVARSGAEGAAVGRSCAHLARTRSLGLA